MTPPQLCPDCGTELSGDETTLGLCPNCLLNLAGAAAGKLADEQPQEDLDATLLYPKAALIQGRVLGDRYEIRSLLGRGGMGEVWRAFDLKLQVEVALKALRSEVISDDIGLDLIRGEVRSAREVISPNVCRVYDLITEEGQEMVSMEFIDGTTLQGILESRAPLEYREASEIAAQFLNGLEAIHQAGLVHRDIKPENIMITRSNRVVVMDFGIAKPHTELQAGAIAGTPGYMAPEQARGEAVDARADVYAAGVVLAEMVHLEDLHDRERRKAFWNALRAPTPNLPDTPWRHVLTQALAWNPNDRFESAMSLGRALEEVSLRPGSAENRSPFPGLASFGEDEAEFFFGRELEVEAIWRKLSRVHMTAVIGPSGAGKSSFLRAGVTASAPDGWSVIYCTPGNRPFTALAQALGPELAGDRDAVRDLPRFDEIEVAVSLAKRWRSRHDQTLVIIDQFEELFTLSPSEVQRQFSRLIGGLVMDADVHVLVSMRDDFLFYCHTQEALQPLFSDLTPLGPPSGAALRRTLVQPALLCGYRYEDEALVDDMLAEIADARGALPLVAFAASRLWEHRDRERGLLTRDSYVGIGGVVGALAQHAEATIERIGHQRLPVAREMFRNLVTAQGTRAVLKAEELLSLFSKPEERQAAEEVLGSLIEARLLTTFEGINGDKGQVEIIHESLLSAWPRLVRWRTQDADNAQLRDQLRQSAQLWDDKGRAADLLWSGTSFQEFELWRERYSGALTATEEAYAQAMMDLAERRQRNRRMAFAATILVLLGVVAVISGLWLQSKKAERRAVAEAQRASASELLAVGQLEYEENPTLALAYAIASLRRSDSDEIRRFALQNLWRAPAAFSLELAGELVPFRVRFSPDGRWLVQAGNDGNLWLWSSSGGAPTHLGGHVKGGVFAEFSQDSKYVVSTGRESSKVWALPEIREIRSIPREFRWGFVRAGRFITGSPLPGADKQLRKRLVQSQPLEGGVASTLGTWSYEDVQSFDIDALGEQIVYSKPEGLFATPLKELAGGSERLLFRTTEPIRNFELNREGTRIATEHSSGLLRLWDRSEEATGEATSKPTAEPQVRTLAGWSGTESTELNFDAGGRWLAAANGHTQTVDLWDLEAPRDVSPLVLRVGEVTRITGATLHPSGQWLATQDFRSLRVWPLGRTYPRVFRKEGERFRDFAFDPGGQWLAACYVSSERGGIRLWSLSPFGPRERVLYEGDRQVSVLSVSPRGDILAAGTNGGVAIVPLDGGPVRWMEGFESLTFGLAFDDSGRRLFASGGAFRSEEAVIRIWDLDTGETRVLDPGHGKFIIKLQYLQNERLVSSGYAGLRIWDLETGQSELITTDSGPVTVSPDGRYALASTPSVGAIPTGSAFMIDLTTGERWDLESHGSELSLMAWTPSGDQIITGDRQGVVRVGPLTGEEPHLLLGHEGMVWGVGTDPTGRWIVSASEDGTVRLWPAPTGEPLQTLPKNEFLELLERQTNYRIVEDEESSSGYRVEIEPFLGWDRDPPTF